MFPPGLIGTSLGWSRAIMVEAQPCCQTVMATAAPMPAQRIVAAVTQLVAAPNRVFTGHRNRRSGRRIAEHGAFGTWQHPTHAQIEA